MAKGWNKLPLFCKGEIVAFHEDWQTPNTDDTNFSTPPESPGVYLINKWKPWDHFHAGHPLPKDYAEIVYIGSSNNLLRRYKSHPIITIISRNGGYSQFYFMECADYRQVEKLYIQKFKPIYNIQHTGYGKTLY